MWKPKYGGTSEISLSAINWVNCTCLLKEFSTLMNSKYKSLSFEWNRLLETCEAYMLLVMFQLVTVFDEQRKALVNNHKGLAKQDLKFFILCSINDVSELMSSSRGVCIF